MDRKKSSVRRRTAFGVIGAAAGLLSSGVGAPAGANLPAASGRRGYADGPFGLVHFQDTGGAGMPLVLCHQSPQTSRQFDSVLPRLAEKGIRAIAIDTPGFGMSDPPSFVPKIEDYAKAIPPVMDHLGIRKAHILGHHTGCMVATEVALQFPDRIISLVMNGPVPMTQEDRNRALAHNKVSEQDFEYMPDGSHFMRGFTGKFRRNVDPVHLTRVMVEKFMGYGPFWYGHHSAYVYDHNAAIARIKHPTLILTNTGDAIYENAQWARRLRPDFAYVELTGGGIDIMDEQPAAWTAAVAAYLSKQA